MPGSAPASPHTDPAGDRPVFELTLRPEPGVDPVPALRAALKRLLRTHGLRCLHLRQRPLPETKPDAAADRASPCRRPG